MNCIPENLKNLTLRGINAKFLIKPYLHNVLSLQNKITEELSLNYFGMTQFEKDQIIHWFGEDKVTFGCKNPINNL